MNSRAAENARLLTPEELRSLILFENADLLAVDKPAGVVCHPSKAGPWSSLSGAVREYAGLAAAHLVTRLDRETSGVVVFAKNPAAARRLQGAMEARRAHKSYLAILTGELRGPAEADLPLGPDEKSPVAARVAPRPDGKRAVTVFTPLAAAGGFTLARAVTGTGRKHQVRAHALALGHPLVGDKLYGPDERLFLEFIETGWTPALQARLLLPRHALHCAELDLRAAGAPAVFTAPLPADLREFCLSRGLAVPPGL